MLKFKIEQIALCPPDPDAAMELLTEMGVEQWVFDTVFAEGDVHQKRADNVADLAFNYTALEEAKELEVLHYERGPNWMQRNAPSVSHLGMHCTEDELSRWKTFFGSRRIEIAQEVYTKTHTNRTISGKRWYHYCIFNTRFILGVDIKFIVRRSQPL